MSVTDNRRASAADVRSLARLAPLLFLVPVAPALVLSLVRLLATGHPVYAFSTSINIDAEAMYLGIWPFQDPAQGFTGDAYTPAFPALIALLDHVQLWTGWPLLLSMLSALGLAAIVARLAYRRPAAGGRVIAVLEAAGVGALALSCIFTLSFPSVYEGRSDHFSWLLAMLAIVLVPRAVTGGLRWKLTVVLLLTLAFWAKQTTIIASVSALVMVALCVLAGRLRFRAALAWMGGLALLNVAVLAVLDALTDGWQSRFNFGIHLPMTRSWGHVVPEMTGHALPVLAFLALAGAAAWLGAGRPRLDARVLRDASDTTLLAVGLAVSGALGLASGIYLRRFTYGDDNNLIYGVWSVAALAALAYSAAGVSARGRAFTALACLLLFTTTLLPSGHWRLRDGDFIPDEHWTDLPASIDRLASRKLVFDSFLSDLGVAHQRVIYPSIAHIQEALLRDKRPKQLEHAILGRRFAVIFGGYGPAPNLGLYPGVGWEDNYYWKLNVAIASKYEPAADLPRMPAGKAFLGRREVASLRPRPGPDPAPWMNTCWSPLHLMGRAFLIHRGGGYWCVDSPDVVVLRQTPAQLSEIVSTDPVGSVAGSLRVRAAAVPGSWSVDHDGAWTIRGDVPEGLSGQEISVLDADGHVRGKSLISRAALHGSGGWVTLTLRRGPRARLAVAGRTALTATLPAPTTRGMLHFWASQNSHAEFHLERVRVE